MQPEAGPGPFYTCTFTDWNPICDLQEWEGTRCANAENFRNYCTNETAGCAEVGGCWGVTPPGNWYPFQVDGVLKRCRCGCVAEETEFSFEGGFITGRDLKQRKGQTGLMVLGATSLDGIASEPTEINGIMWGPEKEPAYRVRTEAGREIILSAAHPVVIGDASGRLVSMKQAKLLKAGDVLVGSDGMADKAAQVEEISYAGDMVNFNVMSNEPTRHIVDTNGLKTGDHA